MKINEGFEVRSVCGEHMMVAMGEKNIDFSHVIAVFISLFAKARVGTGNLTVTL